MKPDNGTTDTTKKATTPFNPANFKRELVGVNPLTIEEGETIYIEVTGTEVEIFPSKKHEEIDFVKAINLQTGEEGHFWLAGQLNHQMRELQKAKGTLQGMKFEIIHQGKKEVDIEGKPQKVNQFKMHLLH